MMRIQFACLIGSISFVITSSFPSFLRYRFRFPRCYSASVEQQIEMKMREKYPDLKSVQVTGPNALCVDGKQLFFKVGTGGASASISLLKCEAEGLSRLADAAGDSLLVPRPWLCGEIQLPWGEPSSGFIVMDAIDMRGSRNSDAQRALGKGMAKIHSAPLPRDWSPVRFGFPVDGCCGALSQPNNVNGEDLSWVEFWAKYRLGFQLSKCRGCTPVQELGAILVPRLGALFENIHVTPSLLHGDLWGGNHAVGPNKIPCIFDPAPYYGHAGASTNQFSQRVSFCILLFLNYHQYIIV